MGYELSKPMLRAELEADLKRCALTVSSVSCTATMYSYYVQLLCIATSTATMYSYHVQLPCIATMYSYHV